jgi:hypothetical protein
MIKYKTGADKIDWDSITSLYGEVGLVAGLGKKRDLDKVQEAFENSYKVVTAWKGQKIVGAGRPDIRWRVLWNDF